MKIGGVQVTEPVDEYLVLDRGGDRLVFVIKALKNMEEFDALAPRPKAPVRHTKDGIVEETDNPSYQSILMAYSQRRIAYMVIRSLEKSNIEWDTVDPQNPKTWANWISDFENAGLTGAEVNAILNKVLEVNMLSEKRLKESRESFLRGQAMARLASSGLPTEQESSQSGEPANASE